MLRIRRRSLDFLLFWMEGFYTIDFAPNTNLVKKLADFIKDQVRTASNCKKIITRTNCINV